MINSDIYAARRAQVMRKMAKHSVAVVNAAPICQRNGDVEYDYRQNSDFYYLTGFAEPDAMLVLVANGASKKTILFNRPNDPEMEVWNGPRLGLSAKQKLKVDEVYSIDQFEQKIPDLLAEAKKIYCSYSDTTNLAEVVLDWVRPPSSARGMVSQITEVADLDTIVHELRLIKKSEEIQLLKKACAISVDGHRRAIKSVRPGMMEYELDAELRYEFIRQGCQQVAYSSIVGGGENSCILHYIANNQKLKKGDLVLVDAGAEYQGYAADITRTYPVSGQFSPEQKQVYELVLKAQQAVIDMIKPGVTWPQMQEKAVKILTEGLVKLGLLKGRVNTLIKEHSYRQFFMHGIGHWLGLDVHDVGARKIGEQWRELKPGMVLTVEPGVYIAKQKNVAKKWWNIGVRIEDDVLVTKNGCEVLTKNLPKTVAEIEQLMAGA